MRIGYDDDVRHTYKSIGEHFGISGNRVTQLEDKTSKALRRLGYRTFGHLGDETSWRLLELGLPTLTEKEAIVRKALEDFGFKPLTKGTGEN